MNNNYNGKHLSLDDRKKIEEGIENGLRKFEIAKSINKSPSTVTKEIKKNRKLKPKNLYNTTDKCGGKGEKLNNVQLKFVRLTAVES